ncbi:MAG TPA: radical SAM protein [Chitinophagales bacterium]|nr:radical SAM protein [Chitinophagales bacterium]
MKVLLICPPPLAVVEPWIDTPSHARNSLAFIAGWLRQYPEYEIKIIEAKFERLSFKETVRRAVEFAPDIVGLTAYTAEIKPAAYVAGLIKKQLPKVITVIGGVHVTAIPRETLMEFPSFDYGIFGEGEITFSELCRAIREGEPVDGIKGLVYRQGNMVMKTAERERLLDQDALPIPAWDLMPRADVYFMQTERGCPFNCVFCLNHNGRVARKRSIDKVIEEMEMIIREYQPSQIEFGDELFSIDMKRTDALLDKMIERGIHKKISWVAQTHVRYVNYALLKKMKDANVQRLDMGVEAGDEDWLREMGKGTNVEMISRAFQEARRAGVETGGLFIFGHPNETVETIRNTIALAVKINPTLPMFSSMTPYPGTEVARLAAQGAGGYASISYDWDNYKMKLGSGIIYRNFTHRKLNLLMLEAYVRIYLQNHRYADFAKFLWDYRYAAWQLLKKIFFKEDVLVKRIQKPDDYEEIINAKYGLTNEDMVHAREYMSEIQKTELNRAKKLKPHLFAEQSA